MSAAARWLPGGTPRYRGLGSEGRLPYPEGMCDACTTAMWYWAYPGAGVKGLGAAGVGREGEAAGMAQVGAARGTNIRRRPGGSRRPGEREGDR